MDGELLLGTITQGLDIRVREFFLNRFSRMLDKGRPRTGTSKRVMRSLPAIKDRVSH